MQKMKLALSKSLKVFFLYLIVFFSTFGILIIYWLFRVNRAKIHPKLKMKVWAIISNSLHNSNSDMIFWKRKFFLIHAVSPFHFGTTECKLVLKQSIDGNYWKNIKFFSLLNEDIRDPKLAVIDNKLFIFALKNVGFDPEPYDTVWCSSVNGKDWTEWREVTGYNGWLFWRPKSADGVTWYVPAYWWEHGKSILLKSVDGIHWEKISTIYEGLKNDETAIEFLPDGRIISTARLEGTGNYFGDKLGCTLISIADTPYKHWNNNKSYVTRLDGPVLFSYNNNTYAIGRYQPNIGFLTKQGSILSRKRTSIYLVEENNLNWLSDLPSAGDTSYGGVILQNDYLYVCYYTNDIKRDFPWLFGMISSSDILMAKIKLSDLEKVIRK